MKFHIQTASLLNYDYSQIIDLVKVINQIRDLNMIHQGPVLKLYPFYSSLLFL